MKEGKWEGSIGDFRLQIADLRFKNDGLRFWKGRGKGSGHREKFEGTDSC